MSSAQKVHFQLSMEDAEASPDALRAMTRAVALELEGHQGALVTAVAAPSRGEPGRVAKGMSVRDILNVEINLENVLAFGRWLRDRLVGTSTKATFEYGGAKFVFDGRDEQQLKGAMDQFERFVKAIDGDKQP